VITEENRTTLTRRQPGPAGIVAGPESGSAREIARPVMVQRWEHLSFLHWPYDPERVRRLLPPELEVDTFDGAAWIGLIPFRLTLMGSRFGPMPWVSAFAEINLRTYVRGPDGERGIWFLSLEASRLGAVVAARAWYRLPYMWSWMRIERRGRVITYRSGRRWPGGTSLGHATEVVEVEVGDDLEPATVCPRDQFVTDRWRLYSPFGFGLAATQIHHRPWPLKQARILRLSDDLIASAGLPAPAEPPVALFSPGVTTRFDRRERLSLA